MAHRRWQIIFAVFLEDEGITESFVSNYLDHRFTDMSLEEYLNRYGEHRFINSFGWHGSGNPAHWVAIDDRWRRVYTDG